MVAAIIAEFICLECGLKAPIVEDGQNFMFR